MTTLVGTIVANGRLSRGRLSFGSHIEQLKVDGERPARVIGPYLLPGFIDVHVHGGGGGDTMDGPEGIRTLARFHARHGTTALLPTTITNPLEDVFAALSAVAAVKAEQARGESEGMASVLGAHLEGPFISPRRLGAQPPCTVLPDRDLIARMTSLVDIRVVTLAPEIEGGVAAAAQFAAAGTRVSLGHTEARHADVRAVATAVEDVGGVLGFTHLYNAMSQLTGREPGAVGSALADQAAFAEVIYDGFHVHEASFLAAAAAKPGKLLLITDAIRAAGQPDGQSELGGQPVFVKEGAARLQDGTLAGSVLTMDRALRNAVASGVDLATASAMASSVPAAYLGDSQRGTLEVGKRADVLVLDDQLNVVEVYVGGERVV